MLKLIRKAIDEGVEALEEIDAKMKYLAEVKEQLKDEPPPLEISDFKIIGVIGPDTQKDRL